MCMEKQKYETNSKEKGLMMGFIGISLCDGCGKRTENLAGKLVLFQFKKEKKRYSTYSPKTGRAWVLCKTCLNKMMSQQTIGDQIKEDIELQIDRLKIKQKEPILLKSND